jgi:hypothetical protein
MDDPKAVKFFEGVLSKTRAGKIPWQPTAIESEYISAIGGQFTLSIYEYAEEEPPFDLTNALVLKDQDGTTLMRVTDDEGGIAKGDIRELYERAKRQALNVDEKVDRLLGELSKL